MDINTSKAYKLEIDIEDVGKRLDILLSDVLNQNVETYSRTRIQQLIKDETSVLVNEKASKNSYKLKFGDEVSIIIPEAKPLELEEENIPLHIVFEDENMLVVNKPTGMLTHPTSIEREHTLVNALLYYCKGGLSGINGIMRPGILHRLDRDTSGLLMIAKNDYAHQFLSEQVKSKTAIRQYLTIVHGSIKADTGVIEAPIDRHPTQRHKMGIVKGGKPSVTQWRVLERFNDFTFLEATLQTGRTHQIRVHFSSKGHPVAGDNLYGGTISNINLNGQTLQAYRLSFISPTTKERVQLEIERDNDIVKLLNILRQKEKK